MFREYCFTALHVQGVVLYCTTCSGSIALLQYMFREYCFTALHVQGVLLYCTTWDSYSNASHVGAVESKKKLVQPNSIWDEGWPAARHNLGGSMGMLTQKNEI